MPMLLTFAFIAAAVPQQDTVVVRAGAPAWGTNVRVTRELAIGALDGPDEYSFAWVAGVTVGSDNAIYVLEQKPPVVRQYDATGKYIRSFGRSGQGPGEFQRPEALSLADKRLIVRDVRNARLTVYPLAGGAPLHWRYESTFSSNVQMIVHADGGVSVPTQVSGPSGYVPVVMRYAPNGTPRQTISVPNLGYKVPSINVRTKGGSATLSIPFAYEPRWTYSPDGRFFGGLPDRYAIHVVGGDKVHRIERTVAPVPIDAEEREGHRKSVESSIRRSHDPAFSWDGSGMPTVKPFFNQVFIDADNRIWVWVSTPSVRYPPENPNGAAVFRSPAAYDVYDPTYRFLGTVRFPESFMFHYARGDYIWGTETDADGVAQVVRYRRL